MKLTRSKAWQRIAKLVLFIVGMSLPCVNIVSRAQAASGVAALQVTAPNGRTSILLGSIHVPWVGLRQPSESVLDGAKRYVVEGLPSEDSSSSKPELQDALDQHVYDNFIKNLDLIRAPWAVSLTDDQVAMLRQRLLCFLPAPVDNPEQAVGFMLGARTAELADIVAYIPCAPPGMLSRDNILAKAANVRGIPFDVLEESAAERRQHDAVPANFYAEALQYAFTPEAQKNSSEFAPSLNSGDYNKILSIVSAEFLQEDAATYYRIMVGERNAAWMPPLLRYLDDGRAIILVGSAHLAGPEGLIARLRQAGYIVEPIEIPSE